MLESGLKPLYVKYNTVLKPLIAEYEARNEDFVTPLLIDLPDMFDYAVLYANEHNEVHRDAAEKCLDKAIFEVRTCLVGSMMEDVEKFKTNFTVDAFQTLKDGHFYGKFSSLERKVRSCKDTDIEQTYTLLKEMQAMIHDVHDSSLSTSLLIDSRKITVGKWIITILIAIIVNFLIYKML